MRAVRVVGAIVVAALVASAVVAGCSGGGVTPAPEGSDACVAAAGSISTAGSASCSSCLQDPSCTTALQTSASSCTCNDTALTSLTCIEQLNGKGTLATESSCVSPLTNSTDSTLEQVGTCLQTCAGPCGGGPADAGGGCESADANLLGLLGSGTGACATCLDVSCESAAAGCAQDCQCNATTVTALECLAGLTAGAPVASVEGCVAPLTADGGDTQLAAVGQCMLSQCGACGGFQDSGGVGVGDAAQDGAD